MKNKLIFIYILIVAAIALHGYGKTYVTKKPNYGRVMGGQNATIEKFPFMVSVYVVWKNKVLNYSSSVEAHICGGSIINDYWVLSAAHCADNIMQLLIPSNNGYFRTRSNSANNKYGYNERNITLAVVHNSFLDENFQVGNDIALFKVNRCFFGINERPIKLATLYSPHLKKSWDPWDGRMGSGWGLVSPLNKTNILQYAEVMIPKRRNCVFAFEQLSIKFKGNPHIMYCAGHKTELRAILPGDSGGPLFEMINNKPQLLGITSYLIPIKALALFTRVKSYLQWINCSLEHPNDYLKC